MNNGDRKLHPAAQMIREVGCMIGSILIVIAAGLLLWLCGGAPGLEYLQ